MDERERITRQGLALLRLLDSVRTETRTGDPDEVERALAEIDEVRAHREGGGGDGQ